MEREVPVGEGSRAALTARREAFRARLAAGPPLVLDGATGTELERHGVRCELPLWSAHALLEAPRLVEQIHRAYARAGADVITANTFRTQRRTLERAGLGARARELSALAIRLAREAARAAGPSSPAELSRMAPFVAGSDPPLEDCFRPDLVPDDAVLAAEHAEHVAALVDAGADVILVETMNTAREARAALGAARRTGTPALVSFTCQSGARLRSGEPLAEAIEMLRDLAPDAVLVNCAPPSALAACLPVLASCGLAFGAYPNLGAPSPGGGRSEELDAAAFAELGVRWAEAGARILGGCCGTTPEHIRALAHRIRN